MYISYVYCITSREQISEESFKFLLFLPLKDTVFLWEVSTMLSRGRWPDPVVPWSLISLLRATTTPLGERKITSLDFLGEKPARASHQIPICLESNLRNSYSSPTTPHPGQEFSLLFPWELFSQNASQYQWEVKTFLCHT